MPSTVPHFGPGSSPLAGAPIGWAAPPPGAPVTPASYLAELIDVATGEVVSLTDGLHPVDAIVREQLRVVMGSGAAVLADGQNFARIQYNDDQAAPALTFQLDAIFNPLAALGWVQVVSLVVQAGEDRGNLAAATVVYRNLLLSAEEARTIEIG